jgi:glycosidase
MAGATCFEKDGKVHFSDERLELAFDRKTGRWLSLRDTVTGGEVLREGAHQAPVVLTVGGVSTATRARGQVPSVVDAAPVGASAVCTGYQARGSTLALDTRDGDWLLRHGFTLTSDAHARARVDRTLRIEYQGTGEALLRCIEVRIPPADLGPAKDCFVEAPAYPTKAHQPLTSLPYGEPWKRMISPIGHAAPGWTTGFFAIDNPGRPLTLGLWVFDDKESCDPRVVRGDHGTRVSHVVDLAGRFRKGTAVEWDGQHILVAHAPWQEAMHGFQDWYDEIGWKVPADIPEWSRSMVLYNCPIGDLPNFDHGYRDMDALAASLPRLKELGFTAFYIMPHLPLPAYNPVDYFNVDLQYGSAEGLKRLVRRAHELDLKAMLDVVIHGVIDRELVKVNTVYSSESAFEGFPLPERHPWRDEHPEWFMKTEYGTPAATFTWSFDHANESFRDFMAGVFAFYVREFDVDGFRVDAPTWVPFPNWAEGLPYRASASIYGSAALFERARTVVSGIKPGVLFYSEAPGPVFMRGFDTVYNYDMQWLYSALLMPKSDKGYLYIAAFPDERITAADLGPWLEQQRLARPRGAFTVQHLDSSDSHGWSNSQFRKEVFGEAAARALFLFNVAIAGPIHMLAGAEVGMEDFYRNVFRVKRSLPALDRGSVDFLAVQADDPHVFTPLRVLDEQVVIPVINISDSPTETTFTVPPSALPRRANAFRVVDRMNGSPLMGPSGAVWTPTEVGRMRVQLAAFQGRMLEILPA